MGKVFIDGKYLSFNGVELLFSFISGDLLALDLGGEYHNINDFTYSI